MNCYNCDDGCIGCERLERENERLADMFHAEHREVARLQQELTRVHLRISKILTDSKIMQGWQDVRNEGASKGSWTQ